MPTLRRMATSCRLSFAFSRYTPKTWLPEDSVVIANPMVKDLNYHYFYDALAREKILAKLGPELTADLYVNRSWHDRPPTVMREDLSEPEADAAAIPMTMTTRTTILTTRSRRGTIAALDDFQLKDCR